jgi:hypothetical protein
MPMPWTYRQATREWQAFLADARAALPPFAAEFWSTPGIDPQTLGPGIV